MKPTFGFWIELMGGYRTKYLGWVWGYSWWFPTRYISHCFSTSIYFFFSRVRRLCVPSYKSYWRRLNYLSVPALLILGSWCCCTRNEMDIGHKKEKKPGSVLYINAQRCPCLDWTAMGSRYSAIIPDKWWFVKNSILIFHLVDVCVCCSCCPVSC